MLDANEHDVSKGAYKFTIEVLQFLDKSLDDPRCKLLTKDEIRLFIRAVIEEYEQRAAVESANSILSDLP